MADPENTRTVPEGTTPDPTPLKTDADFAAAEAELREALAEAEGSGIDGAAFEALRDRWQTYHGALLNAEPRTPFQAATILRAGVLCPVNGIIVNCANDDHIGAIRRVADYLGDGAIFTNPTTVRNKVEALRHEVLGLPCETLIPPEPHDNRQKYAMFLVLDYVMAAINGDDTPMPPLMEAIKDLNARLPQELARDAAADDAELLATIAEYNRLDKVYCDLCQAKEAGRATEAEITACGVGFADLGHKMAEIPAMSLTGILAKLRVVVDDLQNGRCDWSEALAGGLVGDVERMIQAGRAAA
ncbi:MAG: hypothetical protein HQL37_03595 [Alphaproteobacteria bacterium]|nr:hypothetical protein [Alphaproteobacteria bacterium]